MRRQKNRVVFVVHNFMVGGAERLLAGLILGLKDRFDLSVVCVCGAGPLALLLKKKGVPVYAAGACRIPNTRFLKIFWILRSPFTFFRVFCIFFRLKPDIAVTSLYQADILGGLAAFLTGVERRIIIQHDHEPMGFCIRWLKRKFLIMSFKVIANSKSTADFLKTYWGVDSRKISIIPNGVSIRGACVAPSSGKAASRPGFAGPRSKVGDFAKSAGASPSAPFGLCETVGEKGRRNTSETKAIRLGFLGRLESSKGLSTLVEAIVLLQGEGYFPELYIAGTGTEESTLKKRIAEKDLSNIRLLGVINNPVIFFKEVDIVVIPSIREGFGLVALEALLSEKCVVASDIPSFRDLIVDGKNGFLFPPKDSESLARVLKKLILDRTILKNIQLEVEKWMEAKGRQYDEKVMIEKYADVLNMS